MKRAAALVTLTIALTMGCLGGSWEPEERVTTTAIGPTSTPTLAPVSTPTLWPAVRPTSAWHPTPTPTPSVRESINCEYVEDEGITRCYGDGAPNFETWASAVRELDWECSSGQPPAYSNEVRSPPFQADLQCEGYIGPVEEPKPYTTPYPTPEPERARLWDYNTSWLEYYYPELHERISALRWVRDGLTGNEVRAAETLAVDVNEHNVEFVRALLEFPWVQDGITHNEMSIIAHLTYLGYRDVGIGRTIAAMPFLKQREVGGAEAKLMQRLDYLKQRSEWDGEYAEEGREAKEKLREFLSHASVRDGITTSEVLRAWIALEENADEVTSFLTNSNISIETERNPTALTPNMRTSIVRTGGSRYPPMIDIVSTATRIIEEWMGLPLPTDHVVITFVDREDLFGSNAGDMINIHKNLEEHLLDEPGNSFGLIAHEIAHYYWTYGESWINEGLAQMAQDHYLAEVDAEKKTFWIHLADSENNNCKINLKRLVAQLL